MKRTALSSITTLLSGMIVLTNNGVAYAASGCDKIQTSIIDCNQNSGNPVIGIIVGNN